MKLYYIEKKIFNKITEEIDYQLCDVSMMPLYYTSKEKAIRKAQRLTDYLAENCRYDVTIETDEVSAKKKSCLYAALLKERQSSFRMTIRVYEVKTR